MPKNKLRILLSEGSSTNARETITALGLAGYTVDLLDPSAACLGRFSRFVRRVHRCPASGVDPIGYLRTVVDVLHRERYDVLFPANEQAYLFAWARDELERLTGLAVADLAAFQRVQTKTAFNDLLDELGLGHPQTRSAAGWDEIESAVEDLGMPCYVKTAVGTASTGVWRVGDQEALAALRSELRATARLDPPGGFIVQREAGGSFEQSHGIFDHGRLVALRCTRRTIQGARGGAAAKTGVVRAAVERDYQALGRELRWHGSFSADYYWDAARDSACYIDANPRITEPMNALFNGVNLAELQVLLSVGEHPASVPHRTGGAHSHNLIQVALGAAAEGEPRLEIARRAAAAALRRGPYRDSRESMTPVSQDPPSAVAVLTVLGALLVDPTIERRMTARTIARYSLDDAITRLPLGIAST